MTIALNQPSVDQTKGKKQFKEALANPSLILLKKRLVLSRKTQTIMLTFTEKLQDRQLVQKYM